MGNIVPFKQKKMSPVEQAIRERLHTYPDNLNTLCDLLILKVQEGGFSSKSDYAKKILKCLDTTDKPKANSFLFSVTPLIEALDWSKLYSPEKKKSSMKSTIATSTAEHIRKTFSSNENPFEKDVWNIYKEIFKEHGFLDGISKLTSSKDKCHISFLGKTDSSNEELMNFYLACFNTIFSRLSQIECFSLIAVSGSCECINQYLTAPREDKVHHSIAESFLTEKFQNNELTFQWLYRLFALRYFMEKPLDDICNAIINKVPSTTTNEIYKAFMDEFSFGEKNWSWDIHKELEKGDITVHYKRDWDNTIADFMKDFYWALDIEKKYEDYISLSACEFFSYTMDCPLGHLLQGLPFEMYNPEIASESLMTGFFSAGRLLYQKGLYQESLHYYKTALFIASLPALFEIEFSENPLAPIRMDYLVEATRKLGNYKDMIDFFSKLLILAEYGSPVPQGIRNEIEITIKELGYEQNAKTYHKIDEFYELVAREDFPSIQSHFAAKEGESKFVLTRDQLQVFFNKIQEKSDIIRGLKSISAKCDMMLYMHREVYDKQAAILEALSGSHKSIEALISENAEKIIENIHRRNESFSAQVNIKTCQDFYYDLLGNHLWLQFDENTRKYLLLAKHLDTTTQFSPADEFGFVAIEYALAIENEFKRKLIDTFLSKEEYIAYKASDKTKSISRDTKVTLGEICLLIDKARKVRNEKDVLWPFYNFVITQTIGKESIFQFKNSLFEIKDRYRNPAAHPSNYSRDVLDSFKILLFEQGFLKRYLTAIQIGASTL